MEIYTHVLYTYIYIYIYIWAFIEQHIYLWFMIQKESYWWTPNGMKNNAENKKETVSSLGYLEVIQRISGPVATKYIVS